MFRYSREDDGYDGVRDTGGRYHLYWWFEAWGTQEESGTWTRRDDVQRPPTPKELATANYIVFGFRQGRYEYFRTRMGGLDARTLEQTAAAKRRRRKR